MNSANRVCDVVDELYEEIDPEPSTLTPMATSAVLRRAAEMVVEGEEEERVRICTYLRYICPTDMRLELALQQVEIGAHRRNRSQSMEAIVEDTQVRRKAGLR